MRYSYLTNLIDPYFEAYPRYLTEKQVCPNLKELVSRIASSVWIFLNIWLPLREYLTDYKR